MCESIVSPLAAFMATECLRSGCEAHKPACKRVLSHCLLLRTRSEAMPDISTSLSRDRSRRAWSLKPLMSAACSMGFQAEPGSVSNRETVAAQVAEVANEADGDMKKFSRYTHPTKIAAWASKQSLAELRRGFRWRRRWRRWPPRPTAT